MLALGFSMATIIFMVTSFSMPSMTSSYGFRRRKYVGEVLIIVEWSAVQAWWRATGRSDYRISMSKEIRSIMMEVNKIYESLEQYRIYLQFQIKDIQYINNVLPTDSEGKAIDSKLMDRFEEYTKPIYERKKYDLAILYTGVTDNNYVGAYGVANPGSVCKQTALSVVRFRAEYNDVLITAHEIGHIMGASHEVDKMNECSSVSGHIMNGLIQGSSPNRLLFSSCSAKAIKKHLQELTGNNCLEKWDKKNDIQGSRYASLVSPDDICQRWGRELYLDRKKLSESELDICAYMPCTNLRETIYLQSSPEGLPCGKSKRCKMGRCIRTLDGDPNVSETCPFGDQPRISSTRLSSCSQMTRRLCSDGWKTTCCKTCSRLLGRHRQKRRHTSKYRGTANRKPTENIHTYTRPYHLQTYQPTGTGDALKVDIV